jgi:hypothetical protein
MNKKNEKIYKQCCDHLDLIEEAILALLKSEELTTESPLELIAIALHGIAEYDSLSDSDKQKFTEINNKFISGEITQDQADQLSLKTLQEIDNEIVVKIVVDQSKKPLLN